MIAPSAPLDAYAEDIARVPGRREFGDHDAEWVMFAHAAQRLGDARSTDVAASERVRRLIGHASLGEWNAATTLALSAGDEMEQAGAFSLAFTTLAGVRAALPAGADLERGLLLNQEARVLRHVGDLAAAGDVFAALESLARRSRIAELRIRADLGIGLLARARGDYPSARTRFKKAVRAARRSKIRELLAAGHHNLVAAAVVARDFDTALEHGWAAYSLVRGNSALEGRVLVNVGAVCSESGHDEAALSCFLRAAELEMTWRWRVPALANAAFTAARLGDRRTLDWCLARLESARAGGIEPYEECQVSLALAETWLLTGDHHRVQPALQRAMLLAERHGFHELRHAVDVLGDRARHGRMPRRPALHVESTERAREAIRQLEGLATLVGVNDAPSRP